MDKGILRLKHKKYALRFKLTVIYAKEQSVNSTVKKIGMHRKSVWKKQENLLRQDYTFCLEGVGRKLKLEDIEKSVGFCRVNAENGSYILTKCLKLKIFVDLSSTSGRWPYIRQHLIFLIKL